MISLRHYIQKKEYTKKNNYRCKIFWLVQSKKISCLYIINKLSDIKINKNLTYGNYEVRKSKWNNSNWGDHVIMGNDVKVLIADDASFMRTVLKDILKSNGLATDIVEAPDGVEAVRQFIQHKPDLVTMDVNMPKADGIQALKGIMKVNPMARVIMVTSVEQKHVVQDAMKSGARDYIIKPFEKGNVGLVFNKVLRSK